MTTKANLLAGKYTFSYCQGSVSAGLWCLRAGVRELVWCQLSSSVLRLLALGQHSLFLLGILCVVAISLRVCFATLL